MPITVAQPAPFAPGVASAYGGAQQYVQDAGFLNAARNAGGGGGGSSEANAYLGGQSLVNQRSIAAGNNYAQEAMQHEALLQRAQQAAFEQTHQSAMQDAQQTFAAQAQQQHAQNQAALQDQHFRQQVDANAIALTQAEQSRLTRYQNADADIDRMAAENSLQPEEAAEMKAHIRGLRGPLELRAVKAQAQVQEAHAKQYEQQAQLETQLQVKRAALAAKTAEERTVPVYNAAAQAEVLAELGPRPQGGGPTGAIAQRLYDAAAKQKLGSHRSGVDAYIYTDIDGKTHIIKPEKSTADNTAQELEHAKGHWEASHKKAMAALDVERRRATNPKTVPEADIPINTAFWADPAHQQEFIDNYMQRQVGAKTPEAYVADVVTGKSRPPRIPGSAFNQANGSPTTSQPQPVAGQPGQPQGGMPKLQDEKPQPPIAKLTEATVEQKKAIDLIQGRRNLIDQADVPEAHKQDYRQMTVRMIDLLREYGSLANMPPEEQQNFTNMKNSLAGIPGPKGKEPTNPIGATARFVRAPGQTILDSLRVPSMPRLGERVRQPGEY